MAWHIVQKLVEGSGEHSTLIGKFWNTLFFVIRFLLVVSIAKNTWGSTQGDFVCNTESPGCKQVCFNSFNPIAPVRYWFFQILAVGVASIIFNVYTTHKLDLVRKAIQKKKKWQAEQKQKKKDVKEALLKTAEGEGENKEKQAEAKKEDKSGDKKDDEKVVATKLQSDHPSKLYLAYFAMVFFRLALEVAFMVGQYYVYSYKFVVPELFQCRHWPCPNVVDCFVSRPKEKTIMLCAFYATGCIMVVINIMELVELGAKLGEAWETRHQDITKEVFGEDSGPQFDTRQAVYNWAPGAEGIYAVRPSGYPDAVGIPMLYTGSPPSGRRKGRRHGLGKSRY